MTLELNASVPWSDAPHATPLADVRRAQEACRGAGLTLDEQSVVLMDYPALFVLRGNRNVRDIYGKRGTCPLVYYSPACLRDAFGDEGLSGLKMSEKTDANQPPPPYEVWLYSRAGDPEPVCVLKVG